MFNLSIMCLPGSSCFLDDSDYPGDDLNACEAKTDSAKECQQLCQAAEGCVQFTWIGENSAVANMPKACCLKNAVKHNTTTLQGVVSGPKLCRK